MRFAFTDEQEMLREAVRGALTREIPPQRGRSALEDGDGGLVREFAERQGWLGIGIDEAEGGQGGGVVELAVLFEELGRVAAPDPLLPALGLVAGIAPELDDDPAGLRAELVADPARAALAVPADRLPGEESILAEAREGRDGWTLTAAVPLVLGAGDAQVLLVPARTPAGASLFAVAAEAAEARPAPLADLARRAAAVMLAEAPGAPLLGGIAERLAALAPRVTTLVAADALGNARRMLEMTVAYTAERVQFGVPVGSFQAVKHLAAQTLVELEAAHAATYYAAWSIDSDQPDAAVNAAAAGWYATTAAARAGDTAHALHGAVAFTWEHDLHFHLKRARADTALFGGSRLHLSRVADALELDAPQPAPIPA